MDHRQRQRGRRYSQPQKVWRPVVQGVASADEGNAGGGLDLGEAAAADGGLCFKAARPLLARQALETGEVPLLRWWPEEEGGDSGRRPPLEMAAEAAAAAFLCLDRDAQHRMLQLSPGPSEEECGEHWAAARLGAKRALQQAQRASSGGGGGGGDEEEEVTRAAGIARVNAFQGLDGALAVFERCSRFNHSCMPNAEYGLKDDDIMKARTVRPVACGEEVCVSYLGVNGLLTTEARRKILKERYLFHCLCGLCTAAADEFAAVACTRCGERAVPGGCCVACGSACEVSAAGKEVETLQVQVAMLEATEEFGKLETRREKLGALRERARGLGLQHHVVWQRLQILLLETIVATLGEAPLKKELAAEVDEAWRLLHEALAWFKAPWNPLRHGCWGIFLAEHVASLLQLLLETPGRKNRARAQQLSAILRQEE